MYIYIHIYFFNMVTHSAFYPSSIKKLLYKSAKLVRGSDDISKTTSLSQENQ